MMLHLSKETSLAWMVHAYTAFGGVVGMMALFAAADGEINTAFLLLMITAAIDATDGMLARRLRVKEVLPNFDGAMIDNVIDVLTFIWIPVFIMGAIGVFPHILWLAVPLVAGIYAYGQSNMKTDEGFFIGFPSYWNIVALYLYWLHPAPHIAVLIVVVPAILTFIPTRYLYASKNRTLAPLTWGLGIPWFVMIIILLLQNQKPDLNIVRLSLFFPAYYMLASFYVEWQYRTGRRQSDVSHNGPVILQSDD
jgi:phosphatidylcholine synthase